MIAKQGGRVQSARAIATALLLGILVCTAGSAAIADDKARVHELRARMLADDGQCEEALSAIERADARADDPDLALIAGRCEVALGYFARAADRMQRIFDRDPEMPEVALVLGMARYHAGDYVAARAALEAASGRTQDVADLDLYTGLVLLRTGEARDAALAFERARQASPETVEPMASYYASIAWERISEADRAEQALRRVEASDPSGRWSKQAREALAQHRTGDKRWWALATVGVEYDTNVLLLGDLGSLNTSQLPADDDDFIGVWSVQGGGEILKTENWAAAVQGSYAGNAHFDLTQFDTHTLAADAWLDRRLSDQTFARARYAISRSWLDEDDFVRTHRASLGLVHDWGNAGTTTLEVAYLNNAFLFDLAGFRQLDRDGEGVRPSIEHRVRVGPGDGALRAGYHYLHYWADGRDFDYDEHGVHLGYSLTLPWELLSDLLVSYAHAQFDNPSFFDQTGPDRNDDTLFVAASLECGITKWLSASARYRYTLAESNVAIYDYDRHLVGLYLTAHLP